MHGSAYRSARPRAAFTLIEALVSISITAIAGSVLLSGIGGSVQTASDALSQTVALGMAQQLMDEAIGNAYKEPGVGDPATLPLGPDGAEQNVGSRKLFDDTDDYNTLRSQPPTDFWGIELGKDDGTGVARHRNFWAPTTLFDNGREEVIFFHGWRQEVDVYYVSESNLTTRLPAGQYSDYRIVEVRIVRDEPGGSRELANLRRVVAYVSPLH